MGIEETNLVQKIRIKAAKLGLILFRNNIGKFQDATGRWISYGVGGNGGSDLIGGTPVTITQDMIGQTLCVLTCYECKTWKGKVTEEQQNFIDGINKAGGIARIIRRVEDL